MHARAREIDIIIIMYIYHALINALSAHMIHINLNMIFYTHVKHSPTKTIYICEQVLFVYVSTLIPPCLTDQRNFITVLIVTREPEQKTLLFWSAACGVTPHGLYTADGADSRQCAPFSNLFSPLTFWPLVCLPTLYLPSPFHALSHE